MLTRPSLRRWWLLGSLAPRHGRWLLYTRVLRLAGGWWLCSRIPPLTRVLTPPSHPSRVCSPPHPTPHTCDHRAHLMDSTELRPPPPPAPSASSGRGVGRRRLMSDRPATDTPYVASSGEGGAPSVTPVPSGISVTSEGGAPSISGSGEGPRGGPASSRSKRFTATTTTTTSSTTTSSSPHAPRSQSFPSEASARAHEVRQLEDAAFLFSDERPDDYSDDSRYPSDSRGREPSHALRLRLMMANYRNAPHSPSNPIAMLQRASNLTAFHHATEGL